MTEDIVELLAFLVGFCVACVGVYLWLGLAALLIVTGAAIMGVALIW